MGLALSLLASTTVAQKLTQTQTPQELAPFLANRPAQGLPGAQAGTERWIVHFATRTFELSAFRNAVLAKRPANEVAAIVQNLEQLVVADQQQFVQAVKGLGGTVTTQWWLVNAAVIEVAPGQLVAVRALNNVAFVQPDERREPVIGVATNSNNHSADGLQNQGFVGAGVCVGVIDTGQDENMGGTGRPHQTYFIDGDEMNTSGSGIGGSRLVINRQIGLLTADDVNGHGTGVASICAGAGWSTPQADDGHAPMADVAGYSLSNDLGGFTTLAIEASAWQSMAADRVAFNIVSANMSYSASPDPLDVSSMAIDSAAYNADVMACCAAGNNGSSTDASPSCANGLAVAALNADVHTVASFSSRGPLSGDPQRFYPDIAACGVNAIMATLDSETSNWTQSGTSMASPQVAGAAAQLRARFPLMTALETKAVLLAAASRLDSQNPGLDRNDYGMGFLRNDRSHALTALGQHGTGSVSVSTPTDTFTIPVIAGQSYRIAITWHRQNMGSTNWADLNLEARDNTGLVIANSSTPRNLYEVVEVFAPFTGVLTLAVTGATISNPTEPYSWAWTDAPPVLVQGTATTFGNSCAPIGFELNTSETAAAAMAGSGEFAYGLVAPSNLSITGFEVYTQSLTIGQSLISGVYGNTSGTINQAFSAVRVVPIGTTPGFYRATFASPIAIPAGPFWISLDHRAQSSVLSNMTAGTVTQCYQRASILNGPWTASLLTVRPAFRLFVKTSNGGGQLSLAVGGAPTIGTSAMLNLTEGPSSGITLFGLGLSDSTSVYGPLPLSLDATGALGCSLLMSAEVLEVALTDALGNSSYTLSIPNAPSLVSTRLYAQGIAWAPGANPLGLTYSNGANLFIGN